jgi:hypothetical protein
MAKNEKPRYNKRDRVNNATEDILKYIKPGDVVNQDGKAKWWEIFLKIGYCAIRRHQKKLFGKNSNWRDTHTMLYLDKYNTFSVEPPKATKKPLKEYCLSNMSIYRLELISLTPQHIEEMDKVTDDIVGEDYDYGQLMDIAINQILGFKNKRELTIFDFGRKKKVCSVGVRIAFEKLYENLLKTPQSPQGKWLFHDLNKDKWSQKEVDRYTGTDIELTAPAHFANSDYFCFEFKLIARFKDGKKI